MFWQQRGAVAAASPSRPASPAAHRQFCAPPSVRSACLKRASAAQYRHTQCTPCDKQVLPAVRCRVAAPHAMSQQPFPQKTLEGRCSRVEGREAVVQARRRWAEKNVGYATSGAPCRSKHRQNRLENDPRECLRNRAASAQQERHREIKHGSAAAHRVEGVPPAERYISGIRASAQQQRRFTPARQIAAARQAARRYSVAFVRITSGSSPQAPPFALQRRAKAVPQPNDTAHRRLNNRTPDGAARAPAHAAQAA